MDSGREAVAVTVVVPARNAQATIGATLAALARQRLDGGYEVIVVDSGSSDGTVALVAAAPAVATLLHNPAGEPAGSRNLGARHGRGEVLAFTDADCEPAPDWLAAGLRALAEADLVQGRVIPARPPGTFERTVSVDHDHGLYETANLFVKREMFERVGGFIAVVDPAQVERQPFGEDAWFGWRVRRSGARAAFAPDAVVRHAVFERGAAGYIAERARCRHFPPLVALIPELREQFLHRRLFLSPSSARFDVALAGVVSGAITRRVAPVALGCLPYALALHRESGGRPVARRATVLAARLAADTLAFAALVRGSIRARSLVL